MSSSKRILLTFTLTVVVPILFVLIGGCLTRDKYFLYAYQCSALSFYAIHVLAIVGSVYSLYLNRKSLQPNLIWYFVSGIILLIATGNILLLSSLSNFGF